MRFGESGAATKRRGALRTATDPPSIERRVRTPRASIQVVAYVEAMIQAAIERALPKC